MNKYPLSLAWLPLFIESVNRAFLGSLYGWECEETADPLKRVIFLRFKKQLTRDECRMLRTFLISWCEANDCIYKKYNFKKYDFKAIILLKGLGPKQDNSPFS